MAASSAQSLVPSIWLALSLFFMTPAKPGHRKSQDKFPPNPLSWTESYWRYILCQSRGQNFRTSWENKRQKVVVFSFDINDIVKGNIKTVDTCSQAVMMGITFTHWVWILRSKSNIWNYHRCNAELEKKSMSKSTGSSRKSSFLLCNMAVTNQDRKSVV